MRCAGKSNRVSDAMYTTHKRSTQPELLGQLDTTSGSLLSLPEALVQKVQHTASTSENS